jgi:hypothetical protein
VLEHVPLADFDLAAIWILTETLSIDDFIVEGFYAYQTPAKQGAAGRPYGGVAVLVAPAVPTPTLIASGHNFIILRIESMILVAAYFSPDLPIHRFMEDLVDLFAAIPAGLPVLLAGDFNARIDKPDPPLRTRCFLNFLNEEGLWLCSSPEPVTYEAHNGSSTVDLFASSLPAHLLSAVHQIEGRSIHFYRKHRPVCIRLRRPPSEEFHPAPPRRGKLILPHLLWGPLAALQRTLEWTVGHVNVAATLLGDALRGAVPIIPPRCRRSQPWFDRQCYQLRAQLIQALVLFRSHAYMRPLYVGLRSEYKACLQSSRMKWQKEYEKRLLAAAEAEPYRFGQRRGPRASCPISGETMREHFRDIAGGVSSAPPTAPPVYNVPPSEKQDYWGARLNDPFCPEEVQLVINSLPGGKAEGPDGLRYEHIKNSPEITLALTDLFNRCLVEDAFPEDWSSCLMVLIPKGKGDLNAPEAWRGISKKSVLGKLLASLLAKRLLRFLRNCDLLPLEQHGFLPGRSTATAIKVLTDYLDSNTRSNGTPVYAIFIDFKAAFNTASRTMIIKTLAECGVGGHFLGLINAMLAPNLIHLFDGIRILPEFVQETGLPQGDTIASLLFVVLLMHLPEAIKNRVPDALPDLYADDLLILALRLGHIGAATLTAKEHAAERGLEINWRKTRIMKFRRGGRCAASDVLVIDGITVPFVSSFVYLGVTFTVTSTTFSQHVQERRARAITAIRSLPTPRSLSLQTAMGLFRSNIAPIASYGIALCWEWLKVCDFEAMDGVQMCFLRRVLGVSKFARSRLVILLTGAKLTSEALRESADLPCTPNYRKYLERVEEKLASVDAEFFVTPAMLDDGWKQPLSGVRSTLCRHAIHGFHHKFCVTTTFHEPDEYCQCRYCGGICQRYHFSSCLAPPVLSVLHLA